MELHFEADEDSGKPALLLVHGLLSSRRHWIPNRALAERFRLIVVDLPAHGQSPVTDDPHPDALAAALDRVRARLSVPRWCVCGQSFGAALTLRYTLAHPERVIAQVFTNANGAFRAVWDAEQTAEHARRIDHIAALGHAGLRVLPFHPAHARRFPDAIRQTLTQDADAVDLDGFLALMREAMPRLSLHDRFATTARPTLLVNGRFERRFQPTRAWLATALPDMAILDLDGGHSINIEQPDAFNAAVTDFLEGALNGALPPRS